METDIAKFVKETRTQLGWTQERMGAELGLKRATIGNYETGEIKPSALILLKIQDLAKQANTKAA